MSTGLFMVLIAIGSQPYVAPSTQAMDIGQASLTITGSNFNAMADQDIVSFSGIPGVFGYALSATSTSIVCSFPSPPSSGGSLYVVVTTGTNSSALTQVAIVSQPCETKWLAFSPSRYLPEDAIALIQSATGSISMATWQLSDPLVVSALATASSSGVSVGVVADVYGASARSRTSIIAPLLAAGVTVTQGAFPHRIANNFFVVDGGTTAIGNYYFSPHDSSVQLGSYLQAVACTSFAASAASRYALLVSSGTPVLASPMARASADRDDERLYFGILLSLAGVIVLALAYISFCCGPICND